MSDIQEEHTFNPSGVEEDYIDSVDLGDHEFEVDMLAAQTDAELETDEPEAVADEEIADDTAEDTTEEPEAELDADAVVDEAESEEVETADALADPSENPLIPRERLNQANRKRQEEADRADQMAQRVNELESQINSSVQEAGVTGVDPAIIKEAAEKVLDGDTEAFSTMMAEQFNNMQKNAGVDTEALLEQATQNAVNAINQNAANLERQNAADEWIAIYPELDHTNADTLNQEALDEAIMLGGMYEDKGYAPGVAMERAVKAVAASHDLQSSEKVEPISKTAVKKTVIKKTARRVTQPAPTGETGGDSIEAPRLNAEEMTQDEWDALPESTREQILTG